MLSNVSEGSDRIQVEWNQTLAAKLVGVWDQQVTLGKVWWWAQNWAQSRSAWDGLVVRPNVRGCKGTPLVQLRVSLIFSFFYFRSIVNISGQPPSYSHSCAFHNLRDSLSSLPITRQKSHFRTTQDILRHSSSATTLDLYTRSPMAQRIAAQESVLNGIAEQPTLRARIGTVRDGSRTRLRRLRWP